MRVVALEEHFSVPKFAAKIPAEIKTKRGFGPRTVLPGEINPLDMLPDLSTQRLESMDKSGITMQVLSVSGPGAELVAGQDGVDIARGMNDALAEAIQRHPTRFAGFAHLPLQSPEAAAAELVRCVKELGFHGAMVNGTIDGRFLDDARFDPVLSAAEQVDLPIYIHPHMPPPVVKAAYYDGLPETVGHTVATAAWGWHSETAIHLLRMVTAGTLDKHRKLKIIIGHMGEMLPVMLARIDEVSAPHVTHLERPISQAILEQCWITTSGIFTQPPLVAALMTFGLDRIMFSVDYPYTSNESGRSYLNQLTFSAADMAKFTHGTADALLRLKA